VNMAGPETNDHLARYSRQIVYGEFGLAGQQALAAGKAVIIGVGGLGTWLAEMLARAGVGSLRLVDDDKVDLTNIHRQGLYDESNASAGATKVQAAAERLQRLNAQVSVDPVIARVDRHNIKRIVKDADVILDGTDNFHTRYLINDVSVKTSRPWVFAGVIGCQGQTMTIVPGQTPCLRCVLDAAPAPREQENARNFGVLGPVVAAIASIQACEAIKILSGKSDRISRRLVKLDLWDNTIQTIDLAETGPSPDCTCCGRRVFEYLHPQDHKPKH